jgi:hypothetical protein
MQGKLKDRVIIRNNIESQIYDPFQVISIDPMGPINPVSIDGFKYALIAGDYKNSKYLFIRLIKTKAESLKAIKSILTEIEVMHHAEVREIQSDSDVLFVNDKSFIDMCKEKNILPRYSPPYIHRQNGYIERNIGILTDLARTMMIAEDAPHNLWSYAMVHAVYVLNRTPREGNSKTPFESAWGFAPDLYRLRLTWYQECYYYATKDERKIGKWQNKGRPCRLLGIDPHTKDGYIVKDKSGSILTRGIVLEKETNPPEFDQKKLHDIHITDKRDSYSDDEESVTSTDIDETFLIHENSIANKYRAEDEESLHWEQQDFPNDQRVLKEKRSNAGLRSGRMTTRPI